MNWWWNLLKAPGRLAGLAVARVLQLAMSNRGLATLALAFTLVLAAGPWLRPSISRDFRGVNIPWGDSASTGFLPERAVHAPRAWRWDSVGVPLLVVSAVGMIVVWVRPAWTSQLFGLLLLLGIPALAASLWNHPGLFEFFEGEEQGRRMVRTMFRHHHDDMMTVRAPDRLTVFGASRRASTDPYVAAAPHPLLSPWRYSMYGSWVLAVATVGLFATQRRAWPQRVATAAGWGAAGCVLALAATWPRLVAEYHLARVDRLEGSNQFEAARHELENARRAMRCLGDTRRYWVARGRLAYRLQESPRYTAFFTANQYLGQGDALRARAELEPYGALPQASLAEKDLLSDIVATIAVRHIQQGQRAGAKQAWQEAVSLAPWKPASWASLAAAELAESPHNARALDKPLLEMLISVGDCFVGSDLASALGDAYFEIGEFERARDMYTEARRLFDLPKYVNLHAQEGRLGM